jgi:hypothetical protein
MTRNALMMVALSLAVSPDVARAAAAKGPLKVYVTAAQVEARKEVDDATKNALKAKRDQAREARKALEKQLKDQLGKKRESWPPERDDELYAAEEAEALAEADYEYRKIDPKGLSDSVKDVSESIEGKGIAGRKDRVVLATSAAEADLVLEVAARRSGKSLPTQFKPDRCFILFKVRPGAKLNPGAFSKVPANYRPKRFGMPVWTIARPKAGEPAFTFESYNGGGNEFGCQGAAANAAAGAIDKFIEDNHAILTAR